MTGTPARGYFLHVFIYAEVVGHIMKEDRTKRGNVVEHKIAHFQLASHHPTLYMTKRVQRRRVAPELCSS